MNNQQKPNGNSAKWDEAAIDHAYEDLLDIVGWILDQVVVSGSRTLFLSSPALSLFLEFIETIETELLIQWKIKRENGLEVLFSRQNEWLNKELRNDQGYFTSWYELRQEVWDAVEHTNGLTENDAWKRLLILVLTDSNRMKNCLGPLSVENLNSVCRLFEQLITVSPHHLALSFLNLIEIGANCRPDLLPLGQLVEQAKVKQEPGVLEAFFADSIGAGNWEKVPELLLKFWQENSGGIYSCFPAFTIEKQAGNQITLRGIMPEKWMDFDQLIGIDRNRDKLLENTGNFIENRFAHHVLLWGGRGTGKSSSVLALMKTFVTQGLRLIEIRQEDLELIPALSDKLRQKPEKFILFCDDLSFDQESTDYKHLKTILEGSIINPANNLLLIATANRKDLVFRGDLDERFPEQKQLIDEKRAIDDRFGLKLFYEVPVFKDLQKILFGSADKTGLPYAQEDLLRQFNRFAQLNNHDQPSGRTVYQFISEWRQREQSRV
jgi:hypothetical protein